MPNNGALPGGVSNNSPTQSDIANTNIGFSGGLSNINPEGFADKDLQRLSDAAAQSFDALQHRYDNPNWWNVAAGFAKPQLGGFLASLGSASEAMGQNVEEQRANVAPVANAKMNYALSQGMLNQKQGQQKLFDQMQQTKDPAILQTLMRQITASGSDTPVAKAAQEYYKPVAEQLGVQQQQVDVAKTAAEAANKFPTLQNSMTKTAMAAVNPDADPEALQTSAAAINQNLDSARPPQIDAKTWAGMKQGDKLDAVAQYGSNQQKVGMDTEQQFKAKQDNATQILPNMSTMRDLALGKGLPTVNVTDDNGNLVPLNGQEQMQRLLGVFGSNNPFDVVAKALSDGKGFGDLFKGADSYTRQLYQNPDSRAKFEELAKLLASQQVTLRANAENPTNAFQQLQAKATPGVNNGQQALLGMTDLMAHSAHNDIDNYQYILKNNPSARNIGADSGYLTNQLNYANQHKNIANGKPLYDTPDYYQPVPSSMQNKNNQPAVPSTAAQPVQQTQKPSSLSGDAIRAEIARRQTIKNATQ